MNATKHSRFIFAAIALASTIVMSTLVSTPLGISASIGLGKNWIGGDGTYGINNNFQSQTAINSTSVSNLKAQWIWPVPVNPASGDQGVQITPMIVNGVVYVLSQSQLLEAINSLTGQVIWSQIIPISYNYTQNVLDSHPCAGPLNVDFPRNPIGVGCLPSGHYHDGSWAYTSSIYGRPLIWVDSNNYTVYAFDANTGKIFLHFDLYKDASSIPGNYGFYDSVTPEMTIDEQDKMLVIGVSVADGASAGRGFIEGYSLATNPPSLAWRTFLMPPQDDSDPAWSVQSVENMSYAWIFSGTSAVNLKSLSPQLLNSTLYGDWGTMGFNGTEAFAGTGIAFGGPYAFDPNSHMMFIGTGNVSPDWNATFRPGPNLWSDSILAINVLSGKVVWGFQATAHDLWDYDCAWNVILANLTVNGQQQEAVLKSCKNGYTYALNAATGQMLWYFTPRTQAWFRNSPFTDMLNPLNKTQMDKPWANYPSTGYMIQNPGATGTPESNMAYDPTNGMLFVGEFNNPSNVTHTAVPPTKGVYFTGGGLKGGPCITCVTNTTIYGLNANTGAVVWNTFIPSLAFTGGLTVSNGLVYAAGLDGFVRVFAENNGTVVYKIDLGGPTDTQPAIGQDTENHTIIVIPVGVAEEFQGATPQGVEVPGYVVAYTPVASTVSVKQTNQNLSATLLYVAIAAAAILAVIAVVAVLSRRRKVPAAT